MNETLSTRQLRLVVLLGLVVVLAGGYWAVTRHKSSNTTATHSTPAHTTVTPTTPSKTHTRTSTPSRHLATHGLPVSIVRAMRKHSVVVVSLFSPQASLDLLSTAEAKAGAAASGAGFVSIDVYHQSAGIPLLHKLGVVNTPAVLVLKRPANIYHEFLGFTDRDVVAQAVSDAR
jgi:hypothetical protein